jgi:CD109 antigen
LLDVDNVLEVKKSSGEKFEAIRALHTNSKKNSVFVQTDKSMYKPSDNIQFRVLVLDAQTKPLDDAKVEIFISDGAENRIKQFDNPQFNKGVFQNELQLSDLPIMGTWKIHVKVNDGEETVKCFDVAEYVLPKFEVSIDSNPDITFKDGKIVATVKANYTFGKIAKGEAKVTAKVLDQYHHRHFGWHHQAIEDNSEKIIKTVEVDGKKFVEFDLSEDLKINDTAYERTVKLTASFKEELSGKEATATTEVKIHITPHKIELKKSSEKFKPGLPFSVTAILRCHDKNAPVTDADNAVKFTTTYYWDVLRKYKQPESAIVAGRRMKANEEYEVWEQQYETKDFEIYPKNGFAKLDIDLRKNITHFDVKAKYLDTEENIHHVQKLETESDQYIIARVLSEK